MEILARKEHDRSIDIWCLGVVAYVCLSGKFPFVGDDEEQLAANIKKQLSNLEDFYKDDNFNINPSILELLKSTITEAPLRPTIDDILKMEVFKDQNLKDDYLTLRKRLQKNKLLILHLL